MRGKSTDRFLLSALLILGLALVGFALAFPNTKAGAQIGALISAFLGPDDLSFSQRVPVCAGGGALLCVIDGDTLRYGEERWRLAQIDAPELVDPACDAEARLARRARARLAELLSAQAFRVLFDGQDRYGRALVELRNADGLVAAQLVEERLAHWFEARRSWC